MHHFELMKLPLKGSEGAIKSEIGVTLSDQEIGDGKYCSTVGWLVFKMAWKE